MTSAGNDVVALQAINISRTLMPAFYQKILAQSEIDLYEETYKGVIAFEIYIWLLWSVKESAYKYLKRLKPDLIFTPVKFIVSKLMPPAEVLTVNFLYGQIDETTVNGDAVWAATVLFQSTQLSSRSIVNSSFIYSVVNDTDDFKNVYWGVQNIDSAAAEDQSAAVRTLLLGRLKILYPAPTLQISKNNHDIPVVTYGVVEFNLPVSLSHHENFVAYSFYGDHYTTF